MRVALTTVISILSFIHLVFREANAQSDGEIFDRTSVSGLCSTNPCGNRARCYVKRDGTFVCRCKKGFKGRYPKCVDINECLLTPPKCGANKQCLNTKGSFKCPCLPGYVRNSTGACNDVDECASFPCGTDALCTNLPGTYSCTCLDGYYGNPEEACIDIDECEQSPCGMNAYCVNVPESFECRCLDGYDGYAVDGCTDINECESSPCGVNTFCKNLEGSYECQCAPGHDGNPNEGCSPSCYEDGVLCEYGTNWPRGDCRSCCNSGSFWIRKNANACGECWLNGRECDPDTTCLYLCCEDGHTIDGSGPVCGASLC